MKEKGTFNQWIAGIITLVSLFGIILIIFIPTHGNKEYIPEAIEALAGALSAGIIMFLKAGSDAQHDTKDAQFIDALKNSTPVQPQSKNS